MLFHQDFPVTTFYNIEWFILVAKFEWHSILSNNIKLKNLEIKVFKKYFVRGDEMWKNVHARKYYCYKVMQVFMSTGLFAGQHNTKLHGTIRGVITWWLLYTKKPTQRNLLNWIYTLYSNNTYSWYPATVRNTRWNCPGYKPSFK